MTGMSMISQSMTLEPEDIIVEKMHIHYGLKDKNPVDRMRFFQKAYNGNNPLILLENNGNEHSNQLIGRKLKEEIYATSLPRQFEELSIRVFCRNSLKEVLALNAFTLWCKRKRQHSPFPSLSQNSQNMADFDDNEVDEDNDNEYVSSF